MEPQRARLAISLVDLTNLADDCDDAAVDALCARAVEHGTAAVCVWPDFVARAGAAIGGAPVRIATVVNFPTGTERPHAVRVVTERALADGADEIDVVLPYTAFAAGDLERCADVVDAVRETAAAAGRLVKVILETGELADADLIERAATFAVDHGADFIKTSTGKSGVSATPAAVEIMMAVIAASDRTVGIKPSGGIKGVDDAETYLSIAERHMGEGWISPATFRFGASGVLDPLLAAAAGSSTPGESDAAY